LCEELAKEFLIHVAKLGAGPQQEELVIKHRQGKPNYEDKSWIREQKNEECIEGLRNPVFAFNRVPGWRLGWQETVPRLGGNLAGDKTGH